MSSTRSKSEHEIPASKQETGTVRVTLSLDPKLLQAVDSNAQQSERSRSAVFEEALLMWYEKIQEDADRVFYSQECQDPTVKSWEEVTAKAAGRLWDD